MARTKKSIDKEVTVTDVTDERPIVEIKKSTNPDIDDIRRILIQMQLCLERIESHLNGGFGR